MVKIGGGGPKAPDTSGVARAHESVMQSHRDDARQAAQMGQQVKGAVDTVQRQGQIDAEQQARKDRLDVEMAKGDLEFQGEGVDRKVAVTEAGQARQQAAGQRAAADTASKAQRAAAYDLSQRLAVVKAGYTVDGELTPEGQKAAQNLGRDYKKRQALFSKVANGDPLALREVASDPEYGGGLEQQAQMSAEENAGAPVPPGAGTAGEAGISTQEGGAIGSTDSQLGGMGMDLARAVPLVRAGLDFAQLKYVVNTSGEMPDDVMMDSKAWQQFNSSRNNFIAIARSGVMMPPQFKTLKERNRFFNELAAKQVLSGSPAPGSMAEPSMMGDTPPSAGQPDDGTQPAPGSPEPNTQSGPGGYQFSTNRPGSQDG